MRRVSWRPAYGARVFARFIRWEGSFAVCSTGARHHRIAKRDLTWEGQ